MESWIIWGIIAIATLFIEIFTLGFSVICIGIGAVAAAVAAYFGLNLEWQLAIFAIFSLTAIIVVRPLVIELFKGGKCGEHKTNISALVGKIAVVSEQICDGKGRVSIDGDDWKAVVESDDEIIPCGVKVVIEQVNSVILTVKRA